MHEFEIGGFVGLLWACQRMADTALMRVRHAILVRDFADGDALYADAKARVVHHAEHARHARARGPLLAGLGRRWLRAEAPCLRVVEIEHAGRLRLDAHLLLDATGGDGVA